VLHVLLATLQITWSGVGVPKNAERTVPVIVADPPQPRMRRAPVHLSAVAGNASVPAEWRVTPDDSVTLDGTDILAGDYRGYATIRATYGNETASLPAFVYGGAAVNCYLGIPNGLRFDDDGVAQPSGTPRNSDIFVTGPSNQPSDALHGCTGAFITASRRYTIHVPYGGTVLRYGEGAFFGTVRISQWRNDFTIAPALNSGDILLFKTHDGRVVKLLNYEPAGLLSGAYLAGPHRGEFADYSAFISSKYVPRAIFGRHY
jgi:hypothetical protein